MFGFIGQGEGNLIVESNGVVNGSNRDFPMVIATRSGSTNNTSRTFFDYDNVNAVKANQEALINTVLVSYTGRPKTLTAAYAQATGSNASSLAIGGTIVGVLYFSFPTVNTVTRKFRYNSNTSLSPASRKIRYELNYYETKSIYLYPDTFVIGDSVNNTASGTLEINTDKSPFTEGIVIQGAFLTNLNLKLNNQTLKTFILRESTASSITGVLPSSILYIGLTNIAGIASVSALIANCVNAESLLFFITAGTPLTTSGGTTSLTGTLDVSHMVLLKEFSLGNNPGLTNIILPVGKTDWSWFLMIGMSATAAAAFNTVIIDDLLSSPTLRVFSFTSTLKTLTKNIGNSEVASSLIGFSISGNSWTGNISITTVKPSLKEFRTGNNSSRTGIQQNNFATVDITGLTNAAIIDLSGSNISDLQLPVNTVCTSLVLVDNRLDIVTNPNLLTQVNAMTALTTLLFGQLGTTAIGQGSSVNGLGVNPNFSFLINLTVLSVENCKVTGNLTLYNGNKITTLSCGNNPNMTNIVNFTAHTGLGTLYAPACSSLTITSIGNTFTAISQIQITQWPNLATIDMSGKTTTSTVLLNISSCPALTTVTLPITQGRTLSASITIQNCNTLTSVNNLNNVNFLNTINTTNIVSISLNASLNVTFPIGLDNFIPNNISFASNGMNQSNVDATIMNLHTNRAKWDNYTSAKALSIGGTNAAPSGTYQAPVVAGSPASGKEAIWELVNLKGWTINYTP